MVLVGAVGAGAELQMLAGGMVKRSELEPIVLVSTQQARVLWCCVAAARLLQEVWRERHGSPLLSSAD